MESEMIKSLCELAEKRLGYSEPGFDQLEIKGTVIISSEGSFLSFVNQSKDKNVLATKCPLFGFDSVKSGHSQFLHETVKNLKNSKKFTSFIDKIKECCKDNENLKSIFIFLSNQNNLDELWKYLDGEKFKDELKITFIINQKSGFYRPLEDDKIIDWWREYRKPFVNYIEGIHTCSVTGKKSRCVQTHIKKIKGMPNGQSSGDALISVQTHSNFSSYGYSQAEHYPCSEEVATHIADALTFLATRKSEYIGNGKICFWAHKENHDNIIDLINDPDEWLSNHVIESQNDKDERQEDILKNTLDSIRTGIKSERSIEDKFHVFLAEGNSGRIMIKDYAEGNVKDLCDNIEKWFDDMHVYHPFQTQRYYPGMYAISKTLINKAPNIPSHLSIAIYRSAIFGESIPRYIMMMALSEIRTKMITEKTISKNTQILLGILKAYLIRKNKEELGIMLDEDHPNPVYHCGRILGMAKKIHKKSMGNKLVNDISSRFLGAAQTCPSTTIPILLKCLEPHFGNIAKNDGIGLSVFLRNRMEKIISKSKRGHNIPSCLNLEEQSLFYLGLVEEHLFFDKKCSSEIS